MLRATGPIGLAMVFWFGGYSAASADLVCPALYATAGDQVVCRVVNYGRSNVGNIDFRIYNGAGQILARKLNQRVRVRTAGPGLHYNIVGGGPVYCIIGTPDTLRFRGSFIRLAAPELPDPPDDSENNPRDGVFPATGAPNGGEAVNCPARSQTR